MNFTEKSYREFLERFKGRFISFDTPGNGIILRHDVDDCFEKSKRMAEIEYEFGIRSTYFILNTAPYWKLTSYVEYKRLQDLGHEIGWHNNALTEWIKTNGRNPLELYVWSPLSLLRRNGLTIVGTASHGDELCHELKYVNSSIFGFKHPHYNKIEHPIYSLEYFGLEYDALYTDRDGYQSDSGGKWAFPIEETLDLWENENKRYQILVHPQWWEFGSASLRKAQ